MNESGEVIVRVREAMYSMVVSPYNASADPNTTTDGQPDDQSCANWHEAQHVLYQLANLFLLAAYLLPVRWPVAFRRSLAACSCLFVLLWTVRDVRNLTCHYDVFVWSLTILLANLGHLLRAAYHCMPERLTHGEELAYQRLFAPARVPRVVFKELVTIATGQELPRGEVYAKEGQDKVGERLSLLLVGR